MDLNGKVVVITGAYSGLGRALSEQFAGKGCKLVLAGRDDKKLASFTKEIGDITDAASVITDIRSEKDCQHMIDYAVKKFGRVDLLVNNAGVWEPGSADDVTEKQLKAVFETNVFGTAYCSKYAARRMKKQGKGIIVNIASTAGIDYKTNLIAYSASKHAIVGFTGSMSEELKGTEIKILCFCPGGIKTGLYRKYPKINANEYMEPNFVAQHLIRHIENPSEEWLIVLRRPK